MSAENETFGRTSERPKPGRSGAITYADCDNTGMTSLNVRAELGKPCRSSIAGVLRVARHIDGDFHAARQAYSLRAGRCTSS